MKARKAGVNRDKRDCRLSSARAGNVSERAGFLLMAINGIRRIHVAATDTGTGRETLEVAVLWDNVRTGWVFGVISARETPSGSPSRARGGCSVPFSVSDTIPTRQEL